jgi:hypothetical protein
VAALWSGRSPDKLGGYCIVFQGFLSIAGVQALYPCLYPSFSLSLSDGVPIPRIVTLSDRVFVFAFILPCRTITRFLRRPSANDSRAHLPLGRCRRNSVARNRGPRTQPMGIVRRGERPPPQISTSRTDRAACRIVASRRREWGTSYDRELGANLSNRQERAGVRRRRRPRTSVKTKRPGWSEHSIS